MRFAELALLALPFVVFVAWRLLAPSAGPPRVLVIAVTATVVAMSGLLLILWYQEAEPPGIGYVPARLEDGRVVPERTGGGVPVNAGGGVPERAGVGRREQQGSASPRSGVPGPAQSDGPVRK